MYPQFPQAKVWALGPVKRGFRETRGIIVYADYGSQTKSDASSFIIYFVKTKEGKYEIITSRDGFDFSTAVFAMVDLCLVLLQSGSGSLYGS